MQLCLNIQVERFLAEVNVLCQTETTKLREKTTGLATGSFKLIELFTLNLWFLYQYS